MAMAPRLSRGAAALLDRRIEELFARLKSRLLGGSFTGKRLLITTPMSTMSLPGIFEQAASQEGGYVDKDLLSSLLEPALDYVDKAQAEAKAATKRQVQAILLDAQAGRVRPEDVRNHTEAVLIDLWRRITSSVERVVETEAHTAGTMGTKSAIEQVAAARGVDDPVVVFLVKNDQYLCLEESEPVLLSRGRTKPAGDLRVGDFLAHPTKPGENGGVRVLAVQKKRSEVLELNFEGGRKVTCTPDHPILVRAGPTFTFVEAKDLQSWHDVVFADEISTKGERQRVTHSLRARKFMVDYRDAWAYWRANVDDMVELMRAARSPTPVLEKYGISPAEWYCYARHVVFVRAPDLRGLRCGVPGNRFNAEYLTARRASWGARYTSLGGDGWLREAVGDGGVAALARTNNFPVRWLRAKAKTLGVTSRIKARGGSENWRKNRDLLLEKARARGTPHFQLTSAPEREVGALLEEAGLRISRHHQVENMKVDFFLPDHGVVVEYDGSGHDMRDRMGRGRVTSQIDYARDRRLRELGLRVLRLKCPKDKFDSIALVKAVRGFVASDEEFTAWAA